ncbi:MAG: prepilin-type N-terminal cleavage/methylation domain-containing protein [Candidatus Staskawiczbacteria bacterium]|nr:prepilin-type N-terminal cleavage/methylation domain-containing protein [Candidatus Staskawiczbacteria bacterium]
MISPDQKGFTIIELIVVIAIIAVLSGIVLVNVTTYINRSKNAAIKANMAGMITRAAAYFEQNPSNSGSQFISSPNYTVPALAAQNANPSSVVLTGIGASATNTVNTQGWCACSVIYNTGVAPDNVANGTFCVDYKGYKKVTATACATRCPAAANATDEACSD